MKIVLIQACAMTAISFPAESPEGKIVKESRRSQVVSDRDDLSARRRVPGGCRDEPWDVGGTFDGDVQRNCRRDRTHLRQTHRLETGSRTHPSHVSVA